MATRSKGAAMPEHLRNIKMTGRGVSTRLVDRAFWLDDEILRSPWITAFEAIDTNRDKGPLLKLLRSTLELNTAERAYLADLLDRYDFKRKRGGQRTPAYDRTYIEGVLHFAVEEVRELRKKNPGVSVKKALDDVAHRRGVSLQGLADHYNGRRGSSRRMKRHRP